MDRALFNEIKTLEELHLNTSVRSSESTLNTLLSDDFTEFGSSGRIWNKTEIINDLITATEEVDIAREMNHFTVKLLAQGVVLSTYQCKRYIVSTGRVERCTIRSSIWHQIDGQWKLYFHQGTVVPL